MKQYLLGIDIGTTGTKSILFSVKGEIIGQAYCSYPTMHSQVGYSEQNPLDWWNAVCQTVRDVCSDPQISKNVVGISLSTQGGTVVPVDKDGNPLRNAIVWNDTRCAVQKTEFLAEIDSDATMYKKTGWKLSCGLPCLAIRWIKENEPVLFENTAMFLTVPDYISLKMTGIAAVDPSNVGINQLVDICSLTYDESLLQFSGITEKQLPKIVNSANVIGNLTPDAAAAMGLSTDTVLVAGAHDQYAVALGAGACEAGDILIGSGTCWVVTCIGNDADFTSGLSQSVAAVPGKWGSLWSLSSGGVCLEWWRQNITRNADGTTTPFHTIDTEVAKRKAAEDGLFFFPFSGCSSMKKSFQKASFVGLDLSHDHFHMSRAIMEGIAFQIVWMLEAFTTKPTKDGLKLAGGASKSKVWCQMVADIANLPVRIPETADLACVGAAIMAGVGSGVYQDAKNGHSQFKVPEHIIYPNASNSVKYRTLMQQYQRYAKVLGELYGL